MPIAACRLTSLTPQPGNPGYTPHDLTGNTPILIAAQTIPISTGRHALDVEFYRDIRPILQRSCVQCHSKTGRQEAGLVLDDNSIVDGFDNTYNRLARDPNALFGIRPIIPNGTWRQTNASRYIRMFQSRRSLLMWKIMGRRLDGWTNADHPTESVPGNPATLPVNANANAADLDYSGTIMPPLASGAPPLTDNEKMLFARWIDLGCQVDSADPQQKTMGVFADDVKPVLTVSSPRSGLVSGPLSQMRIGLYDNYSGLNRQSLSVTANFVVNGKAAGSELAGDFRDTGNAVWTLSLATPITNLPTGKLNVRVNDLAGNTSVIERSFSVNSSTPPPVGTEIILDNLAAGARDANRNFTGQWCLSSSANKYGSHSIYSCGAARDTYRWTPAITTAGNYDVFVWWSTHPNRSTTVPISVTHAGGTSTKNFNQQTSGGQWILHGRYNFVVGTSGYVEISDVNGQAAADAVRLVRIP
jgi:hypothetical protein